MKKIYLLVIIGIVICGGFYNLSLSAENLAIYKRTIEKNPALEITVMPIGVCFNVIIKNIGEETIYNVNFNVTLSIEKGFFLIFEGDQSGYIKEIWSGDHVGISGGLIFGFGKIEATVVVYADNVDPVIEKAQRYVIGFFVIPCLND